MKTTSYMPKQVIMADPEYFRIRNENVHDNPDNQPDPELMRIQATAIYNMYTNLGIKVLFIPRSPYVESMIYTANIFFGGPDPEQKEIVLSNMQLDTRFHEPDEVKKWFPLPGYKIHVLPRTIQTSCGKKIPLSIEGYGDLISGQKNHFAGIGQRSTKEAVEYIAKILGLKREIVYLRLINPKFYHLDTCLLSLQDTNHLIYYPEAFSKEGLSLLRSLIYERYEVSKHLALQFLICNSVPLGNNIIILNAPFEGIPQSSLLRSAQGIFLSKEDRRFREIEERSSEYADFIRYLWGLGYDQIPAYTSEFRKDGAGIFCLSNFVHL